MTLSNNAKTAATANVVAGSDQLLARVVYSAIEREKISTFGELEDFIFKNDCIKDLLQILDYSFKKRFFLLEALAHTSFVNEFPALKVTHNEQIEFLGDAVLNLLFSSFLVTEFGTFSEGDLSKFRGSLINKNSFYELAEMLNLGHCVLLGKGEMETKGMQRPGLLADAFEALFGALYRDSNFLTTQKCFMNLLSHYKKVQKTPFIKIERLKNFDAKTKLQEKTMKLYRELPFYSAEESEKDSFLVSISLRGNVLASTVELSKKEGEEKLAQIILKKILAGENLC